MKKSVKSILISCIALILAFSFSASVYAQDVKKPEFGQMTALPGMFRVPDLPSEEAADGLIDLFTVLTGYSETREAKKDEPVKDTVLYCFPPMVWAKTLIVRAVNHPELAFAKQYPSARRYFLNSLFVSATVRSSSMMGKQLWEDLCAEEEFTAAVKEAIKDKDRASFVYTIRSEDLFFSIAHIACNCRRMSPTEEGEQILVEISDYYTFAPTNATADLNSTGELLNEFGWQLYRLRILTPFSSYAMGTITIK